MANPKGNRARVAGDRQPGDDARPLEIFISYRRGDGGRASHLRETLAKRFGAEHVFFDVDRESIDYGDHFPEKIATRLAACNVLIAVVGPKWWEILDEKRRQPLEKFRKDWVRVEIEGALARKPEVRIVPVLVDGAREPTEPALPRPLKPLASMNAVPLRHGSWNRDVEDLIETLEGQGTQTA